MTPAPSSQPQSRTGAACGARKAAAAVLSWEKLLPAACAGTGLEAAETSSAAGLPFPVRQSGTREPWSLCAEPPGAQCCPACRPLPGGAAAWGAAPLASLSRGWGKIQKGNVFAYLSQAGMDPPVRMAALPAL